MTDLATEFAEALAYGEFLENHGSEEDRERWRVVRDRVVLTDRQQAVLGSFSRDMKVLVLAGAWCGDCVNQCPIFDRFALENPVLNVRYLDRDANPGVTERLSVN
ncbi:MAG: thioredoxin family protein, partial [Planctomycetota bacterium]|nr:thioredoxin family protein [Planctomycetota bacterium]